jgi:hypothetical protein
VLSLFLYFVQPLCCLSFLYFVQPLCCLSIYGKQNTKRQTTQWLNKVQKDRQHNGWTK